MSTNWGFVCISHDPELGDLYDYGICGSGDYGKRKLAELYRERAKYIAMDADTADAVANDDRSKRPIWFLRRHPRCKLVIDSEYGERYDPVTGFTKVLRDAYSVRAELLELVEHSRKVTPSPRATVYVGDLEAILHRSAPVQSKQGSEATP